MKRPAMLGMAVRYFASKPGESEIRAFRTLPLTLPYGASRLTGLRWDALVRVSG